MKPLLVITLINHWAIKNFIHSGVAAQLAPHVRLQLWTDPSRFEALSQLLDHSDLSAELRSYPQYEETSSARFWRLVNKSLLYEKHDLSTERIAKVSHRGRRSRVAKLMAPLGRLVAKSPLGNWALEVALRKRRDCAPANLCNFGDKPSAILIGNPFDYHEDPFLAAGFQGEIPVVTMIPSWDNLTSKGVIDTRYEKIFVWNELMANELLRLYPSIPKARVVETGLPRMSAFRRDSVDRRWRHADGRKLILIANTATKSFPQQPQVISHIMEALDAGAFGDASILIRCHPHDNPSDYRHFGEHPLVSVWPEDPEAFGTSTCPPPDDLEVLSSMILSADVVVNAASTIALDAAYCDRPIVSIAYDGDEHPSYADSIKSAYDYEHQKPFLQSGASPLCRSKEELINAIQKALESPGEFQSQRANLAKLISPGDAAERISRELLSVIGHPSLAGTRG